MNTREAFICKKPQAGIKESLMQFASKEREREGGEQGDQLENGAWKDSLRFDVETNV